MTFHSLRAPMVALAVSGLLGAAPASAADPVFPLASHVGLVAPGAMKAATAFRGFEDKDTLSTILIVEMPTQAYAGVEQQMTAEGLKKQGMTEEKRETIALNGGKGVLIVGTQEADNKKLRKWVLLASWPEGTALVAVQVPDEAKSKYSDADMRTALMTATLRPSVPLGEQLSLLPITFDNLSGLRPFRVLGNNSVFMTDGATDPKDPAEKPLLIVTIAPGGPEQTSDRQNFAREVFLSLSDFKEVRIVGSDILRLDNAQTYEIQAEAKDPKTDAPLKVVQWIRFGNGAFIRFVGIAKTEAWAAAFPKFRAVRDGVRPKG
jgi:hypothetical protein